jgi:hypothetical protein
MARFVSNEEDAVIRELVDDNPLVAYDEPGVIYDLVIRRLGGLEHLEETDRIDGINRDIDEIIRDEVSKVLDDRMFEYEED